MLLPQPGGYGGRLKLAHYRKFGIGSILSRAGFRAWDSAACA